MHKWKVIEIRKTSEGEEFEVETIFCNDSKAKLREWLENNPRKIVDKKYRIKELEDNYGTVY